LKSKIQCQENILASEQQLKFDNKVLDKELSLLWVCGIKEGDTITLNRIVKTQLLANNPKIKIIVDFWGKVFAIQSYANDFVKDLKARIYCEQDIAVYFSSLRHQNVLLKDELRLSDYNIGDSTILKTAYDDPDPIKGKIN
jgi:hypothetical protein